MDDLRDRFAGLDRMPMPELWSDVQQRAAHLGSAQPVTSVAVGIPVRSTGHRDRTLALLAAALLVAMLAGAIAVGSGLIRLPANLLAAVVSPSPAASPTAATPFPSLTPAPSVSPAPSALVSDGPAPWIVFSVDGVASGLEEPTFDPPLWAMRADGSGAHEITGGGPVAWSRDGTRLLVLQRAFPDDGSILVAEVGEDIGSFVDTGVKEPSNEQWEAFDFAPDGERVVFMRKSKCAAASPATGSTSSGVVLAKYVAETAGPNCEVLSILNLRTGERTDLDETLVKHQTDTEKPGSIELPAWSPDGTKIAYTRSDQATPVAGGTRELWVVNADGTDPSRVELAADVSVQEPRWSPDGTRISFTSESQPFTGAAESAVFVAEVATGRLERVTIGSDPAARQLCCAEWLGDTRLRVKGGSRTDPDRFWLVALDANPNEAQLLVDLTESLAAIPGSVTTGTAPGDPGRTFFWQPVHEGQP